MLSLGWMMINILIISPSSLKMSCSFCIKTAETVPTGPFQTVTISWQWQTPEGLSDRCLVLYVLSQRMNFLFKCLRVYTQNGGLARYYPTVFFAVTKQENCYTTVLNWDVRHELVVFPETKIDLVKDAFEELHSKIVLDHFISSFV